MPYMIFEAVISRSNDGWDEKTVTCSCYASPAAGAVEWYKREKLPELIKEHGKVIETRVYECTQTIQHKKRKT